MFDIPSWVGDILGNPMVKRLAVQGLPNRLASDANLE